MLTTRDRPRTFPVDLLEDILRQVLTDVGALGLRRECDSRHRVLVSRDELTLALVPRR